VGKTEIRLALFNDLFNAVGFHHLTEQSGNALIGQVAQTINALDKLGHSVQAVGIRGQLSKDNILVAVIRHLIRGRLFIRRVLASEQVNLMVDELNHAGVSFDLIHGQEHLETVALGELLNSRSRHSINSFLWR